MNMLKRVLLAEDDPRDAELTLAALDELHFANEVMVVNDGAEALDYLHRRGKFAGRENGQPAVLLLDLKMPKMDGIQVLRNIKGDPQLKTMPVVILTSSREARDLNECYQLGANAYVVKPVQFHEFVDAVRKVGAFWAIVNEPPEGTVGAVSP